jgi:hypothetical protein
MAFCMTLLDENFPVPINSREEKGRPAMIKESSIVTHLFNNKKTVSD